VIADSRSPGFEKKSLFLEKRKKNNGKEKSENPGGPATPNSRHFHPPPKPPPPATSQASHLSSQLPIHWQQGKHKLKNPNSFKKFN